MTQATLNAATYRFVELPDAAELRERLFARAQALGLRGTVLLAAEGINLNIASAPDDVNTWLTELQADRRFAGLDIKTSVSDAVPFKRLIVKVKREIIRMNQPQIRPQAGRAPAVDAKTLARWLDQGADDAGRPVVMLDTRNGFEVDAGGFEGAIDWRIARFSEFPAALEAHRRELEGHTVVTYCTGGIRCEKAALAMADAGIDNVIQLDGGILRYFEQAGAKHFKGDCFVFDARETLNDTLAPTREA